MSDAISYNNISLGDVDDYMGLTENEIVEKAVEKLQKEGLSSEEIADFKDNIGEIFEGIS